MAAGRSGEHKGALFDPQATGGPVIMTGPGTPPPDEPGAGRRRELTIFAYPWDLQLDGARNSFQLVHDLGCHRVAVAVAYHSAEVIAPRRRHSVQITAEGNVAHLPLGGGFSDLVLPAGSLAREHPELPREMASAAETFDLGLTAWVIVCHNSGLATTRPGTALENCFGDRSGHGLCPSNAAVRAYALELCRQVLEIGIFDELFVESVAYLIGRHGHPHELWAVRDDPATRYLRSLCFCASCMRSGEDRGIDGPALRAFVADALQRTWNSPLAVAREPDPGDELSSLLVSRPDLAAWTAMRCDRVAELVGEIAALAHSHGSRLSTALGVFARPAPLGWMEGADVARLAKASDRLVATAYYPGPGAVARDLDHYLALVDAAKLQLVQTLWPGHHADLATLLAKIGLARSAGIDNFGLYNLTTAPAPALDWVRAVADLLAG
jgi:hypothetical protein